MSVLTVDLLVSARKNICSTKYLLFSITTVLKVNNASVYVHVRKRNNTEIFNT